jgi:VanZ family protein
MRMPRLRRLDLWAPPLLLMGAIFVLSAQPSLDSGLGLLDLIGRKVLHFAEYALLCFLWWRVFSYGLPPRRAILLALLAASTYAATDELHQTTVEGRHGAPLDWAIDTAGAAAAAYVLRARQRTLA